MQAIYIKYQTCNFHLILYRYPTLTKNIQKEKDNHGKSIYTCGFLFSKKLRQRDGRARTIPPSRLTRAAQLSSNSHYTKGDEKCEKRRRILAVVAVAFRVVRIPRESRWHNDEFSLAGNAHARRKRRGAARLKSRRAFHFRFLSSARSTTRF